MSSSLFLTCGDHSRSLSLPFSIIILKEKFISQSSRSLAYPHLFFFPLLSSIDTKTVIRSRPSLMHSKKISSSGGRLYRTAFLIFYNFLENHRKISLKLGHNMCFESITEASKLFSRVMTMIFVRELEVLLRLASFHSFILFNYIEYYSLWIFPTNA